MKTRSTHFLGALTAATVLALALVPVAGATAKPQARAARTTTVQVKAGDMFFKLSTKSLARPGAVVFVVKNSGGEKHDFKINGKRTPLIGPGKTARLTVSFKKKGRYTYMCTVPGHAAAGMKGIFTVR